jgi:non-specific serine/threonine protein kinase
MPDSVTHEASEQAVGTAAIAFPPLPPAPLTSFIGREREVAALLPLVESTRLLTLTGAGGSGKTRLALEIVQQVARARPGTVAWVELAPFHDSTALSLHVATALGIRSETGANVDELLAAAFTHGALLLVLDNCEHLVAECASFAERHLRNARQLRILATSREALGVAGERAWLVPALSLPAEDAALDLSTLARSDAVRLFVHRAQDVAASFELTDANAAAVAQICRQLDGLPLAIELAAARVRVITPVQIAERLGQAFHILSSGGRTVVPRHRTLRETIQWSYDLLSSREQELLQRLSVFAGGFTLEAAEYVCAGEPIGGDEVLDVLAALVDKSLVVLEGNEESPGYRLLETVRQFAAERLAANAGSDGLRQRHAGFYVRFVEAAEPHVFIVDNKTEWIHRVDTEVGNLLAAAEWLESNPMGADPLIGLVVALDWYVYARGRFEMLGRLLHRALARRAEATPRSVARALTAVAHHAIWTGDPAVATPAAEEAVALSRGLDDPCVLADALAALGGAAAFSGDIPRALEALDETGTMDSKATLPTRIFALGIRGYAEYRGGDMRAAIVSSEALIALLRQQGFHGAVAEIYPGLGRAWLALGDRERALRIFSEGIELTQRHGRIWSMLHSLESLVTASAPSGAARAVRLLGVAHGLRDRFGMRLRPYAEADARAADQLRALVGEDTFASLLAEGRAIPMHEVTALATQGLQDSANPGSPVAAEVKAASTPQPEAPPREVVPVATAAAPVLRVLALGRVEVWIDGTVVPSSGWKYAKPRELLLYLLAHPDGCTREQIGLAFWPDASSAQVKNSFHVLLHHLRKTLGRAELITFDGERYRVAWELGIEFDAAAFERDAREGLRALTTGRDTAVVIATLRGAVDLYRGELLAEESAGDWHLGPRERLHRLYVDSLRALAEHHERRESHAEAAAMYRSIVQADELDEEAYRRLMRALARAGDRTQALRAYERLSMLLRADLDAEPEPETSSLFDRLRRAEPV